MFSESQNLNLFLGKFGLRKSKFSILAENWYIEYLNDSDSYSNIIETALTYSAQICPKLDLELKIQKNNVGIKLSILDIPYVPIFSRNGQL